MTLTVAVLVSTLNTLAQPGTRQDPGCAGALAASEHFVRTDYDAIGDHHGLVVFPRSWDPSGDSGPSCKLKDVVVVREYEVLGCQGGGSGKATVKVRYERLASMSDQEFVTERPHDETVALPLVYRRGQWWIAHPQPPRVSLAALPACFRRELADLDDDWWQHASSEQKKWANAMKRTLESLASPRTASGGAFSRSAIRIWGGGSATISSPDGSKAILVKPPRTPDADENHEVVVRAYGRDFETTIGALVNAELAWAPDSSAFFVTYSDGGNVGTCHVEVFRVTAAGLEVMEPIPEGRTLFVPRCADPESPNVGAVGWTERGSRRLLVAVESPPHSSCADMGTFRVFDIELPGGRVVNQWNQPVARKLLGRELGDRLLKAGGG
jgi:hypothetical protein